jgi:hypothetical protein
MEAAMSGVSDLLVTGFFTLAGSLGGSGVTLYAASKRDRQLDRQAAFARNLELRRAEAAQFILAFDEVSRLAARGAAARAEYRDNERNAAVAEDLRHRLMATRTSLQLLCRSETQSVLDEAARLTEDFMAHLSGRPPRTESSFDSLSTAMARHMTVLISTLRAELGEPA